MSGGGYNLQESFSIMMSSPNAAE